MMHKSTYQVQSCSKYISDMQQLYVADVLLWKSVDLSVFFLSLCFSPTKVFIDV